MNTVSSSRRRIARLLGLALASVVAPLVPLTLMAPSADAAGACPVMANALIPDGLDADVPGDLDLCRFSTASTFGQYAEVLPTVSIAYKSCGDWQEKLRKWWADGKPPTDIPGLVGNTMPRFEVTATVLGKGSTRGTFTVRLGLRPSPLKPNPSTITLRRPAWPGITATQNQRINTMLGQLLQHELGHMNLEGQVASAFAENVDIPAKSSKEALKIALTDPIFAAEQYRLFHESGTAVHKVYDGLTSHGNTQSNLGGVNIINFACPQIDLLTSYLEANATAATYCDGQSEKQVENTQFLPLPQMFTASFTRNQNTACVGTSITTPVPGLPAVSGETRTLTAAADSSSVEELSAGPRTQVEHAQSSASTKFVDLDGVVTMEGSLSCQADRYDSKAAVPGENGTMGAGGMVSYRFTVYATSTVTINLTGDWFYTTSSAGNGASYFKTANINWAHYFTTADLGTPYTATLASGSYDFSLLHRCAPYRPPGTYDASKSGALNYSVRVVS